MQTADEIVIIIHEMSDTLGFVSFALVLILTGVGLCQDPVTAGQDNRNVLTAKSNSFDECGVANSLIDDTNNSRLDYGEETEPNEFPYGRRIYCSRQYRR